MWFRVMVNGLAIAGLFLVTGAAPGDSTVATVEHCYTAHGPQEARSTRCTGRWSRFGVTSTGEIHGVDVAADWPVIPPYPRPDGWGEVAVPDAAAARVRPAVAVPGAASVTPWLVWAVRAALIVECALSIVLLAHLVHLVRRRRVAARG